jgi:hypothetical protein
LPSSRFAFRVQRGLLIGERGLGGGEIFFEFGFQ